MNYQSKLLSVLIVMAVTPGCLCYAESSSEKSPDNISQYEFTFIYDINIPGKTPKFRFRVPLPKTIPGRQKITKPRFCPEPSSIVSENGTSYAEFFVRRPPKKYRVEVKIKADLYQYDLIAAQRKGTRNHFKGPNFEQYLKPEKFIESDDVLVQEAAAKISAPDQLNLVKAIFDYVIEDMNYVRTEPTRGAAVAIRSKKGDCAEYATLFAALCRAKKIPARVVVGYVAVPDEYPGHAWAEVYLKDYGWVPFDPTLTFKDHKKYRDFLFVHLNHDYLYLPCKIDEQKAKYSWCSYICWGDKITMKDSFEIKKLQPEITEKTD